MSKKLQHNRPAQSAGQQVKLYELSVPGKKTTNMTIYTTKQIILF